MTESLFTKKKSPSNIVILNAGDDTQFSHAVCERLGVTLGDADTPARHYDTAPKVHIGESLRSKNVFIILPYQAPVGETMWYGLNFLNAALNRHPEQITMVMPYHFGQRGDKIAIAGENKELEVVVRCLIANGANKVLSICPHTEFIQNIYPVGSTCEFIPFWPLTGSYIINDSAQNPFDTNNPSHKRDDSTLDLVCVAPDEKGLDFNKEIAHQVAAVSGRVVTAGACFKSKTFDGDKENPETYEDTGNLGGNISYVCDDIFASVGSTANAALRAYIAGARRIVAVGCHFTPGDRKEMPDRLQESLDENAVLTMDHNGERIPVTKKPLIDRVAFTNSAPLPSWAYNHPRVDVIDLSYITAAAIARMHEGRSMSELYQWDTIASFYRHPAQRL